MINKEIEIAIRETLVIENKESINIALDKIVKIIDKNTHKLVKDNLFELSNAKTIDWTKTQHLFIIPE